VTDTLGTQPFARWLCTGMPEWITAVGTAVTAAGVLLLWKQIQMLWIQIRADHERSRRENSISYLFEWSKGLVQSGSLARRLAETLAGC